MERITCASLRDAKGSRRIARAKSKRRSSEMIETTRAAARSELLSFSGEVRKAPLLQIV